MGTEMEEAPRVLVTGGAGFIGSAVTRDLLAAGYRVRVLDDLSTGRRENLPESGSLEFIEGSILREAALEAAASDCVAVSHQAAMVSVPRSFAEPELCREVNIEGTRRVLEAARAAGVRRAVFASSAAVYGDTSAIPVREDGARLAPASPYGESKLAAEVLGAALARSNFQVTALRYFNVFGPRQALSGGYPALVPPLAIAAVSGSGFTLYGDGQQTRDLVFVADVARANRLALEIALAGEPFLAVNIGTGTERSVLSVIDAVEKVSGRSLAIDRAPARPGDVRRSVAGTDRAMTAVGWRAERPFIDAIAETYDYYSALHRPALAV